MKKNILSNPGIIIPLIGLGLLYFMAVFAPVFSPYQYDQDDVDWLSACPTKIHLFDPSQKKLGLFTYARDLTTNQYYQRIYIEDKTKVCPIKFWVKGFEYKIFGIIKSDRHLFGADKTKVFLFGTDYKGRDIFSRILYGARISLTVSLLAGLISSLIGLIIGGIAGYYGGKLDNLLMRLCEMMMMIPGFYLMLGLRAGFPINLDSSLVYGLIVVIMSFIGWAGIARVIRGMALSLKTQDYVLAAKSLGVSDFKIIWRHILPHTLSYAILGLVLSLPSYILAESALSLIGLGIQDPQASWGNLLSSAMEISSISLYPWILIPGFFIIAASVGFNLLGESLRDVLDPKRKII